MGKSYLIMTIIFLLTFSSGCSQTDAGMKDGYYSAEMAEFDTSGWKEYITIYVSDNKIITVEYDALNASGFIRTWDIEYMRAISEADGESPNEYIRIYETALINWQNPAEVETIPGATISNTSFRLLAEAAIAQARAGSTQVALVELPGV